MVQPFLSEPPVNYLLALVLPCSALLCDLICRLYTSANGPFTEHRLIIVLQSAQSFWTPLYVCVCDAVRFCFSMY